MDKKGKAASFLFVPPTGAAAESGVVYGQVEFVVKAEGSFTPPPPAEKVKPEQ